MGGGKTLSEFEIGKIEVLSRQNVSIRQIAIELHRSFTVIRNYLINRKNYGKKRVGRTKCAISDRERRRILKEASNSTLSARQIKAKLNVNASLRTVQRTIKKCPHLKRMKLRRKPALKQHHKRARMEFAEKHIRWTNEWNNVVFTDEKKFNLDGPDGYDYYFHDLRKEERSLLRRQHGGGSVMVWGAITSKGVVELVVLNGRQTSKDYLELLKTQKIKITEKLEQQSYIFQQDNAPIHTAKIIKQWFQLEKMNVLDWPALSPDLNIIENAWGWLSRNVYAGGRQYDSIEELIQAIKTQWKSIPTRIVKNLFNSMPNRLIEVLKKNGGATSY